MVKKIATCSNTECNLRCRRKAEGGEHHFVPVYVGDRYYCEHILFGEPKK